MTRILKWPALIVLTLGFARAEAQNTAKQEKNAARSSEIKKTEPSQLHVKVFRLEVSEPKNVSVNLQNLLAEPPSLANPFALAAASVSPAHALWHVTTNPRTKSVIVRGTDKQLEQAAELIAIVEAPKDKPLPPAKTLRAYRLKHAEAAELIQVLTELDLNARYTSAERLLVVAADESVLKDVDSLVESLDVEGKAGKQPKKEK